MHTAITLHRYLRLLLCVLLTLTAGGVSGILTADSIGTWYQTLNKPSFNPPNQIFGPVWTTLYLLMGISLWMIWELPVSLARNRALRLFFLQLTLNFTWSFLFFSFHWTGVALAEILALWLSILIMILRFYPLNRKAALLNIPYLLWVSFASILNAAYWKLN